MSENISNSGESFEFRPSDLLDPNRLVEVSNLFMDGYETSLSYLSTGVSSDIKDNKVASAFCVIRDSLCMMFPQLRRSIDEAHESQVANNTNVDNLSDFSEDLMQVRLFLMGIRDLDNLLSK